jgi:HPt (histidine-containing phosphotransfer) domain-containing protein
MGGNRELLRELAGVFCAECPNLLEDMRQAISKHDALRLRRAAHTLKGEVGNFAAAAVFDTALQLERLGRDEELSRAAATYAVLVESLERLLPALRAFAKDTVD